MGAIARLLAAGGVEIVVIILSRVHWAILGPEAAVVSFSLATFINVYFLELWPPGDDLKDLYERIRRFDESLGR